MTDGRSDNRSAVHEAPTAGAPSHEPPAWAGYVVAVLLEVVVTLFLWRIAPSLNLGRFPVYYLLSVAAVAYWFGLGPAVVALLVALGAFLSLFVDASPGRFSLPTSATDWAALIAFLVGGAVSMMGVLIIRRSRKRIQRLADELSASSARMTDILASITDSFLALDREWRLTYVNPEAARILGRSSDELIGKTVGEEMPGMSGTPLGEALRQARSQRSPVTVEEFEPDTARWLNVRIYPTVEGLSVYFQDITERRRAEDAVRRSEQSRNEFLRRTLLAATGGKFVITGKKEIEAISGPALEKWRVEKADEVSAIRQEVGRQAERAGIDCQRRERFKVCVGEALTNSIKHAHGGEASLHRLPDGIMVVISDSGPGIEELRIADVALTEGYSTAGTLGMGYKVMLSFSDKVYLATGTEGTTVALELKDRPSVAPSWADTLLAECKA